jgi:hypothetical protein
MKDLGRGRPEGERRGEKRRLAAWLWFNGFIEIMRAQKQRVIWPLPLSWAYFMWSQTKETESRVHLQQQAVHGNDKCHRGQIERQREAETGERIVQAVSFVFPYSYLLLVRKKCQWNEWGARLPIYT